MEIGESIIIGRMGQQALHLSDASIDPQHATLTRTSADSYVIEDHDSAKGIFVFGLRIMRKTIKADTPLFLGSFKTSVKQLLTDASRINLQQVWNDYDKQKRKWDRYSMLVNSIRMLTPILTMLVTQMVGQNWLVSCIVLLAVMAIAIFAGEKVLEKKTVALATLNAQMQTTYVCPHCHKFLGFVPYSVLSGKKYCPNCGVPIK